MLVTQALPGRSGRRRRRSSGNVFRTRRGFALRPTWAFARSKSAAILIGTFLVSRILFPWNTLMMISFPSSRRVLFWLPFGNQDYGDSGIGRDCELVPVFSWDFRLLGFSHDLTVEEPFFWGFDP